MSNALTSIDYIILESLYFITLTLVNLDFTLTTQVLADGNVLIICLDGRGKAMYKLYMNQVEDATRRKSISNKTYQIEKVGEWQTVED